jgi:choline kinase
VSPALHRELIEQGRRLLADTQRVEYEAALVAASRVRPVSVLVADDLVWTEVDDESHLARARTQIVPRLD